MKARRKPILVATLLAAFLLAAVLLEPIYFTGHLVPAHLKVLTPVQKTGGVPHGFALLVSGGLGINKNHSRYWNMLSLSYIAFETLGFHQISALDSDGTPGKPDRNVRSILGMFGTGELADSPFDLDGDGKPDVEGAATRAELDRALARIGREMQPGDFLVLYFIDHGQLRIRDGKLTSVAMLWNEELTPGELDALLKKNIPAAAWVATIGSICHSGIFYRGLERPNTMFIAAGYPLWIWSDGDAGIFAYHFAEALLRRVPDTGLPLKANTQMSDRFSLREAFLEAKTHDHTPEWPQLWANGDLTKAPPEFR